MNPHPPARRGGLRAIVARLARELGNLAPDTVPNAAFARSAHAPLAAQSAALGETPLVSVVMTCHDTERHLDDAVGSILRQSWKHLELIVVDDASQDGSLARLQALGAQDHRVRIIPLPGNVGTYRAKNTGIHSARGDILAFMDSDDTCHPERIVQQLELLRRPGIVASTCNYVRHTDTGDIILNRGLRERRALISLMIKREVIDDIGWFDSVRTSADDEFFERIRHVYGNDAVANVDQALYFALSREGSLSTSPGTAVDLSTTPLDGGPSPLSAARQAYVQSYLAWYRHLGAAGMRPYIPRTLAHGRPFPAAPCLTR
ncbi:hypothetical protein GCM10007164_17700 [Luteimonas padinae]|uniref:Glycosyltransferase family 2 protein n=1 Tax=Luteimonas padinae TaxID=1714359 RepID=A0ABV6T0R8_9GAMM|nr:glycosyltransferase family A protein [Luteimonas padinae]GHD71451.1 hypothetical protein GCM10007164_17700 [Luteimonas padinae]